VSKTGSTLGGFHAVASGWIIGSPRAERPLWIDPQTEAISVPPHLSPAAEEAAPLTLADLYRDHRMRMVRLAVLLAHRDVPGPMDAGTLADMLVFAGAATDALLGPAADGSEPQWLSDQRSGYRAEVHQATGMISAQLEVSQAEALIRMRAYAFSQRRSLADVAAAVVARLTSRQRAVPLLLRNDARIWQRLLQLVRQKAIKAHIERTISLEEVADAQRAMETGHGRGKIVVRLG